METFCAALEMDHRLPDDDVRPLAHQVMDAFWCHPSPAEAQAWEAYPYDSDPAGTAIRPLGRPLRKAPEYELTGAPETDLPIRIRWLTLLAVAAVPTRITRQRLP
jgi:hypothetical protein